MRSGAENQANGAAFGRIAIFRISLSVQSFAVLMVKTIVVDLSSDKDMADRLAVRAASRLGTPT